MTPHFLCNHRRYTKTVAARRDASWFVCPGVSRRYHVSEGREMAKCNPRMMPLDRYSMTCADRVPKALRCQRNGCKQAWPKEER